MSSPVMTANTVERDEKQLYRAGGICALALGAGYLATIPLYASVGVPPGTGEGWLKYLPGRTTTWWAILGLMVLTDVLFIPVALSLHLALRRVRGSAMLVATAFVGLFVVLDLAVTWTSHASLLTLSRWHAAAASEAQRAAYVAAANHSAAVLASPLTVYYAIVDLALGILLTGLVMLGAAGTFSRTTAYLALAAGVFGVCAVTGSFVVIMANALCTMLWVLLVGYELCRLAREAAPVAPAEAPTR